MSLKPQPATENNIKETESLNSCTFSITSSLYLSNRKSVSLLDSIDIYTQTPFLIKHFGMLFYQPCQNRKTLPHQNLFLFKKSIAAIDCLSASRFCLQAIS